MRSLDAIVDAELYMADQEAELEALPKCDICGQPITDDYKWIIQGTVYCEDCLNDLYREEVIA